MLISYNQEDFIVDACLSVLNQNSTPIEIILSDDCSTDSTYSLMEKVVNDYKGPHSVKLRKNDHNLGLVKHINKVVSLCSGEYIIYAAGDDVSVPDRVQRTMALFDNSEKQPLIVHSGVLEIDGAGRHLGYIDPPVIKNALSGDDFLIRYALIIGATCAWHRSLWSVFGELKYPALYEDLVMAARAYMMAGEDAFAFSQVPLVEYRVGFGISQGGRNKPKSRDERQKFELKNLRVRDDVCRQRLDDAETLHLDSAKKVLEKAQLKNSITRLAYEKKASWLEIVIFGVRYGVVRAMLSAVWRRVKLL